VVAPMLVEAIEEIAAEKQAGRSQVTDVAGLLHPRSSQLRQMAMLRAYLDESTDSKRERVFAIAGYLGTEEEWLKLENAWKEATRGLECFHMAECESQVGEFEEWPKEKCIELVTALVTILLERELYGVCSAIMIDDFKRVFPDEPLDTLYYLCFQHCVSSIAELACSRGEEVAFVFDRTSEFSGTALNHYNALATSEKWQYSRWLGPIAFESKVKFIPLQAADLVAYETFKYMHNAQYDPQRPIRKSIDRLREKVTGEYWNQKSLEILAADMKNQNETKIVPFLGKRT
jgi:hypothetical protein